MANENERSKFVDILYTKRLLGCVGHAGVEEMVDAIDPPLLDERLVVEERILFHLLGYYFLQ